jgi:predicted N-acetyltransferase YhbS
MRIRAARRDDFEAVSALLERGLRRPAVGAAASSAEADCRAVFDEQVVDPNAHHMVVEADGAIVGFCSLHFRTRLNWATPEAWIADLFVADVHANAEVGRALLDEVQRRARERDCHAIVHESGYRHAEEHDLFRGFHMRDVGKEFRRDLAAGARPS